MRTVNVADLQNDLTTYVDYARAGEEVIIRDDDRAVAKLIPFAIPFAEDLSDEDMELVAAGIMTLPKHPMNFEQLWAMPIPKVEGKAGTQALLDEREESR